MNDNFDDDYSAESSDPYLDDKYIGDSEKTLIDHYNCYNLLQQWFYRLNFYIITTQLNREKYSLKHDIKYIIVILIDNKWYKEYQQHAAINAKGFGNFVLQ